MSSIASHSPYDAGKDASRRDLDADQTDTTKPLGRYNSKTGQWENNPQGGGLPVGLFVKAGKFITAFGGTLLNNSDTQNSEGATTSGSVGGGSTYVPGPQPISTPPGRSVFGGDTSAADPLADFERIAHVIQAFQTNPSSIPSGGQPVALPTPTTSNSPIPVLLIIAGLGIVGYMLYEQRKKGKG